MSACEAKQPFGVSPRPGAPQIIFWRLCGEPSVAVYDYWCACGRHSRRGETCEMHRPVEGDVGCSRCWDLADNGHECAMSFAPAGEAPPVVVEAPGGLDVCDLCGMPAVSVEDRWRHAVAADGVFCALLFPRTCGR